MRFALRYTVLAAVAALCGLSACSGDDVMAKDSTAAGGTAYVSVRLLVAQPEATRLGPAGGADGDGREPGMDRENAVSDVTLLLYRQSDASTGLNGDGTATVEHTVYFPTLVASADGTAYTSEAAECGITAASGAWHAIVVANMGDVSSVFQGETLSSVRDHIVEKAWIEAADVSGYTGFAMASAKDATLSSTGNEGDGSEASPYVIHTSIERVAARIDIEPGDGEWNGGASTYTYIILSEDGQTDTGDRFVLTHVMPFNLMKAGSYLLKRVCDGQGGSVSYLGEETEDDAGCSTNYVLAYSQALQGSQPASRYLYPYAGSGGYPDYADGQFAVDPDSAEYGLRRELLGGLVVRVTDEDGVHGQVAVQVHSVGNGGMAENDSFALQFFDDVCQSFGSAEGVPCCVAGGAVVDDDAVERGQFFKQGPRLCFRRLGRDGVVGAGRVFLQHGLKVGGLPGAEVQGGDA